jgi:hypothetical protein
MKAEHGKSFPLVRICGAKDTRKPWGRYSSLARLYYGKEDIGLRRRYSGNFWHIAENDMAMSTSKHMKH